MLPDKKEKLILIGKSGSGKDWYLRHLVDLGLEPSRKTTTRPKRINETNEYRFVSESEFKGSLDDFLVYETFTNSHGDIWYYGISKEEFEKAQIFIMTPGELSSVSEEIRKKMFVVYLDIDRDVREERILKRDDKNDSIKRRMDADEIDFMGFKDYDLKITDPEFDVELVLSLMD